MDNTQEILELTKAVNHLAGVQEQFLKNNAQWQLDHNRSAESFKKAVKDQLGELQRHVSGTPCANHKKKEGKFLCEEQETLLKVEAESTKQKFISFEKRFRSVWGVLATLLVLMVAEKLIKSGAPWEKPPNECVKSSEKR